MSDEPTEPLDPGFFSNLKVGRTTGIPMPEKLSSFTATATKRGDGSIGLSFRRIATANSKNDIMAYARKVMQVLGSSGMTDVSAMVLRPNTKGQRTASGARTPLRRQDRRILPPQPGE